MILPFDGLLAKSPIEAGRRAALPGNLAHRQQPADPTPPTAPPQRRIVYSDTQLFSHTTGTIHFGDRVADTGDGFVHMDVTDDGFVRTTCGGAWFSDGGTPEKIGSHLCSAAPDGEFGNFANRGVMSPNAGSLVACFECTTHTTGASSRTSSFPADARCIERRDEPTGKSVASPGRIRDTALVGEHWQATLGPRHVA